MNPLFLDAKNFLVAESQQNGKQVEGKLLQINDVCPSVTDRSCLTLAALAGFGQIRKVAGSEDVFELASVYVMVSVPPSVYASLETLI